MRYGAGVIVTAAAILLSTGDLCAEEFTASDVLGWDQENQDWYFQVSVTMAGIVAAENNHPTAGCINDWYLADLTKREAANQFIRKTMRDFSDYHPGTVLAAVIENECGTLNFSK